MDLIPLNLITSYSFLSSAIKLDKFFAELKNRNINACAITDINNLMGYPEFDKLSNSFGVSPLFGMKTYLEDYELNFYVLNEKGYENLIKISYFISKNRCRTSTNGNFSLSDDLNFEGLAAIISSESSLFDEDDEHQLARDLFELDNLFKKNFYVGIECYEKDDLRIKKIRNFLVKHPFKSIAFPLIKYIKKDEDIKIKLVDAIKNDYKLDFENEQDTLSNGPYYFRNEEEFSELYTPDEILETHKLHSLSTFKFKQKRGTLLHFDQTKNSQELLKKMCFDGLLKLNKNGQNYVDRLNYELNVIHEMGYDDYFLLVQDYVQFAKNNDIIVGPGRGSAAGSLVAYSLNITELDPLENGLLFERFLNKARQTMPDIDVDFEDTKRDIVVKYIQQKYGEENVTQIATVQEIKAKQAIRDIGRIYDLNPIDIDKMSKLLIGKDYTLMDSYNKLKTFRDFILSDVYYQKIFKLALKIEGLPRQRGIHPSGIVINQERLDEKLPMFFDEQTKMNVSQFEMNNLEDQGFLKMDILALTNLSTIHLILNLIKINHGTDIKFQNINYHDRNIYENIISKGLTMGVFQLESVGMNNAISILKPNCFEDIVNLLALYRPGPMDQIEDFARLKNSSKQFASRDKELEDILKSTFGKIIYQEQIMQIASRIAGFSANEADLFRRAISKKNIEKLAELKQNFVNGCIKNHRSQGYAEKLFDLILKFANYGFNKSHSAVYAIITCKMAWLKYYYPQEFYIALLSAVSGVNETKFSRFLDEFKTLNIKIKVPDINKSREIFVAEDNAMIMPFNSIKGLTSESIHSILHERNYKGPFKNLLDFVTRMIPYKFQEKQLEKLIKAGCFDNFVNNRQAMLDKLLTVIKNANIIAKSSNFSLFGDQQISFDLNTPEDKLTKIYDELELLGTMVSYNPITILKENYNDLLTIKDLKVDQTNKIMAIISTVKEITTKKDRKPMAFITINDENSDSMEGIIFTDTYEKYHELIEKNKIVILTCRLELRNGKQNLIITEMEEVKYE